MTDKKILSLGQCAADTWSLGRLIETELGAEMLTADTVAQALTTLRAGGVDLVLVNRILDANGASGLDFIRQMKEDAALKVLPVMLVSNLADAQRQAQQRGALPGFGKSALREPRTATCLREALGVPTAS